MTFDETNCDSDLVTKEYPDTSSSVKLSRQDYKSSIPWG